MIFNRNFYPGTQSLVFSGFDDLYHVVDMDTDSATFYPVSSMTQVTPCHRGADLFSDL
ncbi:MAG: hypothetical protein AMXMBFR75_20040 [Candidatus Hinthialibacteria bacterium]